MAQVPAYLADVMACKANVPPAENEVDIEGYRFEVTPDNNVSNGIVVLLNKCNMDMPNPGETFMIKATYMENTWKGVFMGFHKRNGNMMFDIGKGMIYTIPLELMAEMCLFVEPRLSEDGNDDKAPELVTFEHKWTEDEVNDFVNDGKKRRLADGEAK